MKTRMSTARRVFGSALACLLAVQAPRAAANETAELIRTHVEQLQAAGELELRGVQIAARDLITRIYEARAFAPTWHSRTQIDSLLELINESYLEGLDPRDYHVDAVLAAREDFANPEALPAAARAAIDLVLTDSVIRVGYHLRFGKVDPVALDPHWNLSRDLMGADAAVAIQAAIDSQSMRRFADAAIPRNLLYQRLKAALAAYRSIAAAGGWPSVPAGPTLRPGMADERVAALAARLAMTADLGETADLAAAGGTGPALYTGELIGAVQRFQRRHGLTPDGVVGPATLRALNVPVEARSEQIRANLERARWVFYDPESEFLVVNIAAFELYLVRHGEVVWRTRVQVGQPYRRTPIFASTLRYLVLNPTWTVPPTILRQDFLPALRRDPGYLASRDIDVIDRDGTRVPAAGIDWSASRLPYRLVQRPGPNNALGRVKFMFPNDHLVYLHDTPSRDLFEHEARAFSSGCIRVENPLELAELLLGRDWSRDRIDGSIRSGRTETVFLDEPIAVKLLYWTTAADAAGRISFFPDIYERDVSLIDALAKPFTAADRL